MARYRRRWSYRTPLLALVSVKMWGIAVGFLKNRLVEFPGWEGGSRGQVCSRAQDCPREGGSTHVYGPLSRLLEGFWVSSEDSETVEFRGEKMVGLEGVEPPTNGLGNGSDTDPT